MSKVRTFAQAITIASLSAVAVVSYGTVSSAAETYRLVQAIGNDEHIAAKGLPKAECETRKRELKAVAEKLGTYNEQTGYGSITCLPDSYFE
jgi:hypothetical protein